MEKKRKVVIINSGDQTTKSFFIEDNVNTLAELKAVCTTQGINYSGMTFNEGHAKIELSTDASLLPRNIPYKGKIVNDLTFMLTKPNKKISSGTMTRAEVYAEVKKHNLQQKVVDTFGKNFTQVSTADLIAILSKNSKKGTAEKKEPKAIEKVTEKPVRRAIAKKTCDCDCESAGPKLEEENVKDMFSYLKNK